MESGSMAAPPPAVAAGLGSAPGDKGLKTGALGFVQNVVIGVSSTAPGYSLAASLGLVVGVAGIGLQAPAILLAAFVPMLLIAASYYYMNRADPDCGTTFSWVTKAMGPYAGWIGGWAIIVADIIVMANLAQIAGLYSFRLFDWQSAADSTTAVTAVGIVWIAIMTAICVYGIELSARTQVGLLGAELLTLGIFAVVALVKVAAGTAGPNSVDPSLSWINPFAVGSFDAFVSGVLLSVFIYWGWDSTVTVNEESENSNETPGRAAVVSTVILLATYVIVAIAAQAFDGPQELIDHSDDIFSELGQAVLGSPLDKLLIIAVLTSAAASTQTTILPTARTSLSMARAKAMPESLGRIHPRFLTPHVSTIWMGSLSIVWYVGLTIVSENILRFDRRAGTDDRLLLRAHRLRVRHLLPPRVAQQRPQLRDDRRPALPRRADALRHPREVLLRPEQARELRVGRLVAGHWAAAAHRDRVDAAGRGPHAVVEVGRAPRVLPAAPRGRHAG